MKEGKAERGGGVDGKRVRPEGERDVDSPLGRLNPTKYLVRSFLGGRNSYQDTTWLCSGYPVPLIEL